MNFDFILDGKTKFYKNLNNKKYYVLTITDKIKTTIMINKFKEFNGVIGLDFEFKKVSKDFKDIALFQINLEDNTNNGYIFIFYPPALNNKEFKILIELLTNPNNIKIIHGGESLDISYLFNTLFNQDSDLIIKFIKNLYDTKFLCEYYHIKNNINLKCSIYNLLEEFKILSDEQIKYLKNLEDEIGPIYNVEFNIDNLNANLIEYALYDVLYLPSLLNKFINISKIYKNVIQEFTSIIYYHKKVDNSQYKQLYDKINNLNNSFITVNNNQLKLIDIYYYYYYNKFSNNLLVMLSEITYFKQFIETIIKYCIYSYIIDKYTVHLSNNEIINNNLDDINQLFLKYKNIIKLTKFIEKNMSFN